MPRLHESADHSQPLVPSTPHTTPHPPPPPPSHIFRLFRKVPAVDQHLSPPRAEEMEMEDPATSVFSLWDQNKEGWMSQAASRPRHGESGTTPQHHRNPPGSFV